MIESLITLTNDGEEDPPPLLAKYRRFCEAKALESNSRVRWCTAPGCETVIHPGFFVGGLGGRRLQCPTCQHEQCYDCGRNYHGRYSAFAYLGLDGTTCEDLTDLTLQEYSAKKHLQSCPNCKKQVEKIDACPHMSCPCGHQWCWVCRGNFPCANLHFGKSGYGSSIEIGDLKSMQRLSVFARMVSTCCFFPIFALFIGTGSTVWFSVIFFTCLLLVCFNCLKGLSKIKRFSESLEPVVDNLKYDAKKVAKVLGYACTGFPILFGVILFFALLFLFIALLHIVGIFLIPYSMAYICADFGMLLRVRRKTFDRLFKERGIVAVCAVFFEANQLEPYQSSLNTNFAVIDCSSEFFDSLMMGIPSPKFLRSYCPDKGGHLTPKFVSSGRRALACTMFAFLFPPTFALGCCLAPLAPLFLLPLAAYPRDPVPKHLAPLVSPVVGGIFFCLFAFLVPSWIPSLASVFSLSEGGLVPCIIPACLATVISWVILRRPALSSCACCAPLWLLSYSIPLSLIVGRNQARSYLAFSPVPDIILQLPTMFIMLFIEHLME